MLLFIFSCFISILMILAGLFDINKGGVTLVIIGGVSLMFILGFWFPRCFTKASKEYLNEKQDNIYSIKSNFLRKNYGITIDTKNKTIELEEGNKKKTYHFDEITSFSYCLDYDIKYTSFSSRKKINLKKSYYCIKTKDLTMPVWKIKFTSFGYVNSPKYYDRCSELYEKWHQIIYASLNRNAE